MGDGVRGKAIHPACVVYIFRLPWMMCAKGSLKRQVMAYPRLAEIVPTRNVLNLARPCMAKPHITPID